jgi:transcriptional regulator with XRE-family HTH domain
VPERRPAPFLAEFGSRVRIRRQQRGLTVAQLAELSGISRRMLTQIELGQANPSLVTVDKVARALDTDLAGLALPDEEPEVLTVRPAGSATVMWSGRPDSEALLHVATLSRGGAELWSWTLAPGDRYQAQPDPAGSEELFLVQSGTLTVSAEGAASTVVPAGAAARLASDRDYSYANDGDEPVRFVRVVQVGSSGR